MADLFNTYRDKPVVARNSAPHSGAAAWVRGLKERIEEPMGKLLVTAKAAMDSDQGREIQSTYEHLVAAMAEFEATAFSTWCAQVAATSDEKLNQPLLRTLEPLAGAPQQHTRLDVNFDEQLVRLLRETKYFLLLKCEVPEGALRIFQSSDQFRTQISSLELICSIYNRVRAQAAGVFTHSAFRNKAELTYQALPKLSVSSILRCPHSPSPRCADPVHHPACGGAPGAAEAGCCGAGPAARPE